MPESWTATPAYARALLGAVPDDTSLDRLGLWRTGTFTVPAGTPIERVEFTADQYRRKFGQALELEGFDVLYMGQPFHNEFNMVYTDADRTRFEIKAWVRRRPIERSFWIPDRAVVEMQKLGLQLKSDKRRPLLVKG